MADRNEKIFNELQSIDNVLIELQKIKSKPDKSMIELSGIGAFLMNFYGGVENILKLLLKSKNIQIPQTSSWHRDLLNTAEETGIIGGMTRDHLSEYMAFRHFFVHSYGFYLSEHELATLLENIDETYELFKNDVLDEIR